MECAKISQAWPLYITICSLVLCIISPYFRLIAEVLKELELDLLPGLRFPCTGPSMWSNIRREDGHSTHNLAFCHDVYVTHTSGVENRHQCTQLWCLHQSKYMLTWRTHSPVLGQWSYYICMKWCLNLLYSYWMYTLWTIKKKKRS